MARLPLAGLRARLIALVLLGALPVLALLLYAAVQDRRDDAANARRYVDHLAQLATLSQREIVTGARGLLGSIARSGWVQRANAANCTTHIADAMRQNPQYADIFAAGVDGSIFCSAAPGADPVSVADRDFFQQALGTRDLAIGAYGTGQVSGAPVVVFGFPVLDDAGQVEGVIAASLDLGWLAEFTAMAPLPVGVSLVIADRDGTILAHSDDPARWVGKNLRASRGLAAALDNGARSTTTAGPDGVRRMYAFGTVGNGPRPDLFVGIGYPESLALASANDSLRRDVIVFAIVLVLALVVIWLVSNRTIVRPAGDLLRAAGRLPRATCRPAPVCTTAATNLGSWLLPWTAWQPRWRSARRTCTSGSGASAPLSSARQT